jgi:hypothetical protein
VRRFKVTVVSIDIPTMFVLFIGLTISGVISEFGKDLYHSHVKKAARKAVKKMKVV